MKMILEVLPQEFTLCKLTDYGDIPFEKEFCFAGITDQEISLVCPKPIVPKNTEQREDGWRCFRIEGILDFSLTGILAGISGILAEHEIGIFAVSTWNTDYVLVKQENLEKARTALTEKGYFVKGGSPL